MKPRRSHLPRLGLCASALVALSLLGASPAAAAGPQIKLNLTSEADFFLSGQSPGVYKIEAVNVGTQATSGKLTLEDLAPAQARVAALKLLFVDHQAPLNSPEDELMHALDNSTSFTEAFCTTVPAECEWPGAASGFGISGLKPHERLILYVEAEVQPGYVGPLTDAARVSGGGAPPAEARVENQAATTPPFGMLHFDSSLTDPAANPYTQAGGHPWLFRTEFKFGTYYHVPRGFESVWDGGGLYPFPDPHHAVVDLPPGLIADPQAVPTCSLADFYAEECPTRAVVGNSLPQLLGFAAEDFRIASPVFNLQPSGEVPGQLGITVARLPLIIITAGLRSGSDYGVTATALVAQASVTRARLNLWGVPADPSHDRGRGVECEFGPSELQIWRPTGAEMEAACEAKDGVHPAEVPATPFIAMPTACPGGPLPITGRYDGWDQPGVFTSRTVRLPAVDGCAHLAFEPTLEARPTTNLADSPSGLDVHLHVPQGCWLPEESALFEASCQSDLSEAVVSLPPGLTVNPSSANGLGACSPGQIGLTTAVGQTPSHFTEAPAQCPEQAAIGSAEVNTPLLHSPLKGTVYLATPHQNPFGSLLAAYIVLEGEGLIIKLPGRIEADPVTGQLTGRFLENPQTPFEDFELDFFGGARGDLRTPPTCGEYTTTSQLTPYSHTEATEAGETIEATPIAEPSSTFETEAAAAEGQVCPRQGSRQPNAPVFRAGTESPQAGAFSPFSLRLARADGSQELAKIETTLPPGLTGRLAGLAECSEAELAIAQGRQHEGGGAEEQASPACPASSQVGTVEVAAGAGPTPYVTQGKAYLAGPYKGAPISLAIITPAIAGPFDLGDVLVRTALYVDPTTTQIKAVSDQIPHILQGIPLDVRSITLRMDRPDFTLNPTDCEELGFAGAATSVLGAAAPLKQRFQVGGCQSLGFSPHLSLSFSGSTKRTGDPALKAVLTMPTPGKRYRCARHKKCTVPPQANVARAQVTLPRGELVDNSHIGNVCARSKYLEDACPASSAIGHAQAITPLLDHPLEGPVYLVSGFEGHTLPDVAADLNGQIRVLLHGKTDTVHEALRNTFEVVPDAPVTKFTLTLDGGHKGLIENGGNGLCAGSRRALAIFTGQNGKTVELNPKVGAKCGGKHHRKHHHRASQRLGSAHR